MFDVRSRTEKEKVGVDEGRKRRKEGKKLLKKKVEEEEENKRMGKLLLLLKWSNGDPNKRKKTDVRMNGA